MKKVAKALAVLASLALVGTGFVACSSDDDGDSKPSTPSITISGASTVEVGSSITLTSSETGVTWTSSAPATATVADGLVTGVAAGSVTITAAKDGFTSGTKTITVTTAAGPSASAVAFDATAMTAEDLTTIGAVWDTSKSPAIYNFPVSSSLANKELSNDVVVAWKSSKAGTLRLRASDEGAANITSLNYNGGLSNDGDIVAVGSKITAEIDRYVGVKTVASTSYTYKLTGFVTGIESAQASKGGALVGETTSLPAKVALVAADNTVLAVHTIEMNKGASGWTADNQEFTGTITTADTEVHVVFSREGAQKYDSSKGSYGGSGGYDVVKLELTPAE